MADSKADSAADSSPKNITVFGGGTFAIAVGTCFARNGHKITMLIRDKDVVESINTKHVNCRYLSEYTLLPNITATDDAAVALKGCDFIVHAIPVQASQKFFESVKALVPPTAPIISLSKGIHIDSLKLMCDLIDDSFGEAQPSAYLSGPSFARELMDQQPTGLVVASKDPAVSALVQKALASARIRVYTSPDVRAVEIGGALKNVYAIAAGVAEGMGFKMNSAALLVTRGCAEMRRLATAMKCDQNTLNGLSGIGDLMLTCFGPASRNRSVGVRLGKGEKLQAILDSMGEVAEGVPTAGAVVKLADMYKLDLPLARGCAAILNGSDCREVLHQLMTLPLRPEDE